MKPILCLFLFIIILSLSVGGLAQGMAQVNKNEDNVDMVIKYQEIDQNNDGKITHAEWQAYFDNYDRNGDGSISGGELRRGAGRYQEILTPSDQFRQMDRNGNGVISRSEWTGTTQGFNYLDWDHNDNLSIKELDQRSGLDEFSGLDYNNDGAITYEEWSPGNRRSIEVLDLNHDGKLNRNEFYNQQQYPISAFRELDQNNDGMISHGEWRSTSANFNNLDTNSDNLLSENEFNTPQSNSVAVQILQEIFKKR
ncbi:MAG: hypothetical protein JW788_07565 [Candidatus Omnitrophica bacterium]|nr:hypothetical protein [Candidatus Omnitrophota bacterium]